MQLEMKGNKENYVSATFNGHSFDQLTQLKLYHPVKAALVVQWLACWPLVPKIMGLLPAEAVGFSWHVNLSGKG
jgi:hypothetical protein